MLSFGGEGKKEGDHQKKNYLGIFLCQIQTEEDTLNDSDNLSNGINQEISTISTNDDSADVTTSTLDLAFTTDFSVPQPLSGIEELTTTSQTTTLLPETTTSSATISQISSTTTESSFTEPRPSSITSTPTTTTDGGVS